MFHIPPPALQIDFSFALAQIRTLYLQDALTETVRSLKIPEIDTELSTMVPNESLAHLAGRSLRGELVFPVPVVLHENPRLLGYYRLLYGFSQKEFYGREFGLSRFKVMEQHGRMTDFAEDRLSDLCSALIPCGAALMEGVGITRLSRELFYDLALLTVGPQLRGGANVKKGSLGIIDVFEAIYEIVQHAAVESIPNRIEIVNAAGRRVLIEFAPDPDIIIREEMSEKNFRNIIAIEIKAGADYSNIHNRVGEAEKSHQKARLKGYVECWTVVNVDGMDVQKAKQESPSTNRFFRLSQIQNRTGDEYRDFRHRVIGLTGVKS